jgi:hypothetical protein
MEVEPVLGRMVLDQVVVEPELLAQVNRGDFDSGFSELAVLENLFVGARFDEGDADPRDIEEQVTRLAIAGPAAPHDHDIVQVIRSHKASLEDR